MIGEPGPDDPVEFCASLQGATVLKFDADGAGVVKLTVPADQIAKVARLLLCREQVLHVSIRLAESR